jgi:hypothetical protein
LALNSPTSGSRFVGIVRLRTKATEFSLVLGLILRTLFDSLLLPWKSLAPVIAIHPHEIATWF